MLIREMTIEDYNEIYTFWLKTPGMGINDADSKENVEKFLFRNEGMSFVCEENARIIGTILCGHDFRRGYIYHLAVEETYRGKGIGKQLINKGIMKFKDIGITKIHLFVFNDNELGKGFYDKLGWIKRDDINVYSLNI